jgi:hypothetical protein
VAGDWDFPAQPLRAAGGPRPAAAAGPALGAGRLRDVVAAALARLGAAGVDPALVQSLAAARYEVAPLPAGVLGLARARGQEVLVSPDAAGYGWFVDATPLVDEAFAAGAPGTPLAARPGGPAAGREDLLSVVLHEMGHLAGLPDRDGGGDGLMAEFLAPGVRRTGALDQVFAGLA